MKNVKYISASAGSGKTYSLTKALTEAIQKGDVEPENVILTTFTKAAASEFKEKAKAMLYENGLIMEAARLDQALIGTIHSVAESMILRYWYILGLSPKISPIAEEDKAFFKEQSLVNLLKEEGITFINNTKIGVDVTMDELNEKYDEIEHFLVPFGAGGHAVCLQCTSQCTGEG